MRWPRKTRPNLHSHLFACSMIMLRSEQDATTSIWLTNVRLPLTDCLGGQQTTTASKMWPSRHHIIITSHGENGCRPSGLWIREI